MYEFVRWGLSGPFLRADQNMADNIGVSSLITVNYESVRNGSAFVPAMESLGAVVQVRNIEYNSTMKL
jgi:hypothetical protein